MDMKSAIEQVFVVVDKQSHPSGDLIENAKTEVSILRNKNIHPDARATLEIIAEIVKNVGNGQIMSAKKKCTFKIKEDFDKLIKIHQKSTNKKDNHEDQCPKEPFPDYPQGKIEDRDRVRPREDLQRNTYPDNTKVYTANHEEQERLRAQKASQAMRHNNPEIADLSDTNRPTKIAERFTELYDNEWTTAFETLSEKKKTEERKITQLLLNIVEEAYSFSKKEAERQIRVMNSALMDILDYGEIKEIKVQNKDLPKDRGLLTQYRKEHAGRSVKRLQKNFGAEVKTLCSKVIKGKPSDDGVMVQFGRKAVELTWWMCVQEPPVYMVSTKDKFNPDYYRAYTKSGKTLDFFVWPALKLYEGGGIMTKGVVQYK